MERQLYSLLILAAIVLATQSAFTGGKLSYYSHHDIMTMYNHDYSYDHTDSTYRCVFVYWYPFVVVIGDNVHCVHEFNNKRVSGIPIGYSGKLYTAKNRSSIISTFLVSTMTSILIWSEAITIRTQNVSILFPL